MKAISIIMASCLAFGATALLAQEGIDETGESPTDFVGDIEILDPYSFATLPGAPVAGGYMSVTNFGDVNDKLLSVSTPVAAIVQLHGTVVEGDTMTMREVTDGFDIRAGHTRLLKPGEFHIMFMELNQPLNAGEMFPVTLNFANSGEITVDFAIINKGQ